MKLHSIEYKHYISSFEWEAKRRQRLAIDKNRCVMCGKPNFKAVLQVHHITYKHLGNEDIKNDLVTLCEDCHKMIHRYYDRCRG